jgi:FKBP-type peptidyl-prolyl cis-trans isomerase
MTFSLLVMLAAVLVFTGCAAEEPQSPAPSASEQPAADSDSWRGDLDKPENLKQEFSYAFGHLFTRSYIQEGIDFDPEYFFQGMKEATEGVEGFYTSEEVNEILTAYQAEVTERQQGQQQEISSANLQEAETFLESNRNREGVTETSNGLQYEVVTQGDGDTPTLDDVVSVHYKGSFLDGTIFESSYDTGTPAVFPLGSIIEGWKEGLQLMQVGSTYRFFIHPDLAYGEQGAGDSIGPNKLLIFEIELLGIEE